MKFILSQCIGFIGTLISLYIVQLKKINHILIGEVAANLIIGLNYFLLGGFSGVGVNLVATVQTVISYVFSSKNKTFPTWCTVVFMMIYTVCFVLTYKSPVDIFSYICALLFALAIIQEKSSRYRIFMLANTLIWLIYDYHAMAYSTMLTHILLGTSTLVAIIRLDIKDWRNKQKKQVSVE